MARRCELCGKGSQVGMSLSHSHVRTKRWLQPNLQRVRIVVDGTPRRLHVCTRCLRSLKKI